MLMTNASSQETVAVVAHKAESPPSPKEVSRRILEVRASWDVNERLERRRTARRRFDKLMATLADHEEQ